MRRVPAHRCAKRSRKPWLRKDGGSIPRLSAKTQMRRRHNKRKPQPLSRIWKSAEPSHSNSDQCTGCRWMLSRCVCSRGARNRCIGCGAKLWKREGVNVWWGASQKELCKGCAAKVPPTALVEAAKYPNTQTRALQARRF